MDSVGIWIGSLTYLHTGVRSILYRGQQIIIHWIECHRECTVNNTPVDMGPEIDLHYIILLQDYLVTRIGSVMRGTVIDT